MPASESLLRPSGANQTDKQTGLWPTLQAEVFAKAFLVSHQEKWERSSNRNSLRSNFNSFDGEFDSRHRATHFDP